MIARLLICSSINRLREEITKTLACNLEGYRTNHPDLFYIRTGEKLGITEAKKIKEFFSLKPYSAKGKAVVLEDAPALTDEAQNALLKTIEELPEEATLILGTNSDVNLLPTILSRCEITTLDTKSDTAELYNKYSKELERLIDSSIEERFGYIEKLKEKEEFLKALVYFSRQNMVTHRKPKVNFLKELLQAEQWAKQNVNIRAILEYLMLKMPAKKS